MNTTTNANVEAANVSMEQLLIAAGLLNQNTGAKLVRGIDGEDSLLAQWRDVVPGIDMQVERLYYSESRCYPVYPR
jgi:hypothetical protein